MDEPAEQQRRARARTMSRTIAFTDASVAIALTLLILPLVDAAGTAADFTVSRVLRDQTDELLGFFVSFAVIIRYWTVHRRIWEGLADFDEVLISLNFFWLLTIVFVPFSTALLTSGKATSSEGSAFYIATLAVASLTLQAMLWHNRRHPELRHAFVTDATLRERIWQGWASVVVLLIALAVALAYPVGGLFALVLLRFTRTPLRLAQVRRRLHI